MGLDQLELCREVGGLVDNGLVELVAPGGRRAVDILLPEVEPGDVVSDVLQEPATEVPPAEQSAAEQSAAEAPVTLEDQQPGAATEPDPLTQPSELADANVGLLNRLIGKDRAS